MIPKQLPTDEELAQLARTEAFSDVEEEFRILGVVRGTKRHGYPSSSYYVLEQPGEAQRRHKAVESFLSSVKGRA